MDVYCRQGLTAESISRTAHIDCNALTDDPKPLRNYSIAVRMSWASARTTTVLEDEAYCLLGIFDVQMPLLYGEGAKAFQRLQKEIIGQGLADQSLLAWWETPQNPDPQKTFFLPALAPSAAAFAKSGTVERVGSPKMSWTSEGLSTNVYMLGTLKPDLFFALLGCRESNSMGWTAQEEGIWIPLPRRGKSNIFGRILYASNRVILPWREASRALKATNSLHHHSIAKIFTGLVEPISCAMWKFQSLFFDFEGREGLLSLCV